MPVRRSNINSAKLLVCPSAASLWHLIPRKTGSIYEASKIKSTTRTPSVEAIFLRTATI